MNNKLALAIMICETQLGDENGSVSILFDRKFRYLSYEYRAM